MTEPITFEDARKIARAYLSSADHMVVTSHPAGEALWDGPVTSAGPMLSEVTMVAVLKPDLLPSLLPAYIKLAHQDREWWDALCVFAGCLLRNNVPLADGLRLFIADVLTDNIEPPKRKPGLSRSSLYHRNMLIWAAINELVSRGMTATRNDTSEGHSACDAVAKESGRTYNGVLSVWLKMKRDVNEITARLKKAK